MLNVITTIEQLNNKIVSTTTCNNIKILVSCNKNHKITVQ